MTFIFSDTLATVSKITTLYSRKIDKGNSKNGVQRSRKQYDGCGVYMNRIVNDSAEMIKINDTDISDEEVSSKARKSFSEEFLVRMLEKLNCNSLPCPCRQVTLSRFLQNDSRSKENSVIFVPQLEVYKFYELQDMSTSGKKREKDVLCDEKSETDLAAFSDKLVLQDEMDKRSDREQHLFINANAEEYTEAAEQQGKGKTQLELDTDLVAKKLLDNRSISEGNDTEIKQYGRQQKDLERSNCCPSEKTEWRETEGIREESDSLDERVRKTLRKCCILSSFRKKYKKTNLPHLSSIDSKNSFLTERTSTIFRRPLNRSSSLTGRHCNRTQRMEKRATKTLGIVVGMTNSIFVFHTFFKNMRHSDVIVALANTQILQRHRTVLSYIY
uniref:Uncharacterized protein n=1 Tax=Loa loa TaxID=7209 RepID=A0A1I7VG04_LOALO